VVDTPSESVAVDSSLLMSLSVGLGLLALILAGVAVFLFLQNQGYFTKSRYRSNRVSADAELETFEP